MPPLQEELVVLDDEVSCRRPRPRVWVTDGVRQPRRAGAAVDPPRILNRVNAIFEGRGELDLELRKFLFVPGRRLQVLWPDALGNEACLGVRFGGGGARLLAQRREDPDEIVIPLRQLL